MFLSSGNEIHDAIEQLLSSGRREMVRFAVAYWGHGSGALLKWPYQVVCNLESGACHPREIRQIWERDQDAIRQLDNLHAKIVLTPSGAVVSSANCSANGLGLDREDGARWAEAGFLVTDEIELEKIRDWYDGIWSLSRAISEEDIARLEEKKRAAPSVDVFEPLRLEDLVEPRIRKVGNRFRSATEKVCKLIGSVLDERDAGKVMIWATHLILARNGTPLHLHNAKEGCPEELATEELIWGRVVRQQRESGMSKVKLVLETLARSDQVECLVKALATDLLSSPPLDEVSR